MTFLSENATIRMADGTEIEVSHLMEEVEAEKLTLSFDSGDYTGVRRAFGDSDKTKIITTPNGEYKDFTKLKSITATSGDNYTDHIKVELAFDKYESEIESVRSMIDELQSGLLELFELVYNNTEKEEEPNEEPVEEEKPQEEKFTDGHTDEEIADSFVEDVESVEDLLPQEEEA